MPGRMEDQVWKQPGHLECSISYTQPLLLKYLPLFPTSGGLIPWKGSMSTLFTKITLQRGRAIPPKGIRYVLVSARANTRFLYLLEFS